MHLFAQELNTTTRPSILFFFDINCFENIKKEKYPLHRYFEFHADETKKFNGRV